MIRSSGETVNKIDLEMYHCDFDQTLIRQGNFIFICRQFKHGSSLVLHDNSASIVKPLI